MNKSESRYFNTALLMDKALVSLLAEKDFEFITIKEICERAGVNRSTFYLHYETISDLLSEAIEEMLKQFTKEFPQKSEEFVPNIEKSDLHDLMLINEQYLRPYLTFIQENKNVYRAAFRNPTSMQTHKHMDSMSKHVLMPIMKRFAIPETEQAYWIAFYIQGSMAIIKEWLDRNCSDSIEDIMRIMIACIRPGSTGDCYE